MSIYISKNNQQMGPFDDARVLEMLRAGALLPSDYGIKHGQQNWQKLEALFSIQSPTSFPVSAPIPVGGQGFINQPVVNWARQYLQQPVEVQLRYNSDTAKVLIIILVIFLGLFMLGLPLIILLEPVIVLFTKGLQEALLKGLIPALFIFVVCAGLFFGMGCLLIRGVRSKIAAFLNLEGIETRGGKKYRWENLYYLDYKKVNTNVHGNLAATAAKALIHAGSEKVSIEMVFANGKAYIPPLILNQAEILGLLDTMPAQRRYDGRFSQ